MRMVPLDLAASCHAHSWRLVSSIVVSSCWLEASAANRKWLRKRRHHKSFGQAFEVPSHCWFASLGAAGLCGCFMLCARCEAFVFHQPNRSLSDYFNCSRNSHQLFIVSRLVHYFLKQAKSPTDGTLSLTQTVVGFFKDSGGVGNRRAFLPPKTAAIRKVRAAGPRSKVQGPRMLGFVR